MSVALAIQHAKHMCLIILLPTTSLAVPYFFHDFRTKWLVNIKCVLNFSLYLLSETFFILSIEPHTVTNVHSLASKVHVILLKF